MWQRQLVTLALWVTALLTCWWKCRHHVGQAAAASDRRGRVWHVGMCGFWIGWLVVITLILPRHS